MRLRTRNPTLVPDKQLLATAALLAYSFVHGCLDDGEKPPCQLLGGTASKTGNGTSHGFNVAGGLKRSCCAVLESRC
jgi:hypothetical protein